MAGKKTLRASQLLQDAISTLQDWNSGQVSAISMIPYGCTETMQTMTSGFGAQRTDCRNAFWQFSDKMLITRLAIFTNIFLFAQHNCPKSGTAAFRRAWLARLALPQSPGIIATGFGRWHAINAFAGRLDASGDKGKSAP